MVWLGWVFPLSVAMQSPDGFKRRKALKALGIWGAHIAVDDADAANLQIGRGSCGR